MKKAIIIDICIIIVIIALTLVSALLVIKPEITGKAVVAVGGQITTINFAQQMNIWKGYYGNLLDKTLTDTITFSGLNTDVSYKDLDLLRCYNTEIYATTLGSINWNEIEPATPKDINDFIGDIPNPRLSSYQVFTEAKQFNINGKSIVLYSRKTNSKEGEYHIGILKQGSTPIFVTEIRRGRSFDGTPIDYQMILPGKTERSITYNLFLDPDDDCQILKINRIPSYVVFEGETIRLDIDFRDIREDSYSDNMSYRIIYGAPFDDKGVWTTGPTDSGVYIVEVKVCDTNDICTVELFTVVVKDKVVCGDKICDREESCLSCPDDCGPCEQNTLGRPDWLFDDEFEKKLTKSLLLLESPEFPEEFLSIDERVEKRKNLRDTLYALWDLNEDRENYYLLNPNNYSEYYYYVDLEKLREEYRKNIVNIPENITIIKKDIINLSIGLIDQKLIKAKAEKELKEKLRATEEEFESYIESNFSVKDVLEGEGSKNQYQVSYIDSTESNMTLLSLILNATRPIERSRLFILAPEGQIIDIYPKKFRLHEGNIIEFTDQYLTPGKSTEIKIRYNNTIDKSMIRIINIINEDYEKEITMPLIESPFSFTIIDRYPLVFIMIAGLLLIILSLLIKMRITEHQLKEYPYFEDESI